MFCGAWAISRLDACRAIGRAVSGSRGRARFFSTHHHHPLRGVDTPAVVLERRALDRNISRMAALASRHAVSLRPHIKTHKSLRIAALQRAAGAVGVTCAKPSEAELFLRHGHDVLLAFPVPCRHKLLRVLRAARDATGGGGGLGAVCVMVDSAECVAACADAAAEVVGMAGGGGDGPAVDVLIKVDSGLHRCGVPPDGPELPALVEAVRRRPGVLRLRGLMTHAGHAYGAADAAGCAAIAAAESALMRNAQKHAGLGGGGGGGGGVLSVGSTLTELARCGVEGGGGFGGLGGLAEMRPGNYVFMDGTPLRLGLCAPADVALTVLATVVSTNAHHAIVDAGSKVLSSDQGAHGSGGARGYGVAWSLGGEEAWHFGGAGNCTDVALDEERKRLVASGWTIAKLSEEHGWIELGDALPAGARTPAIGERVRILPNHSCPVANLADEYVVLGRDGALERWPVDARGCTT